MTFIGGFVGIYALMNHCDLFGSAQTANMIGIVTGVIGRDVYEVLLRVLGLLVYMADWSAVAKSDIRRSISDGLAWEWTRYVFSVSGFS